VYRNLSSDIEFESGLEYARIFDPKTNNFSLITYDHPFGRAWYPTAARLSDGRVLLCGGFLAFTCPGGVEMCTNPGMAIFNVSQWDAGLSPWQWSLPANESNHGINPGPKDYTRIFALPRPVLADGLLRQAALMGHDGVVRLFNADADTPFAQRFYSPPGSTRPGGCNYEATALQLGTGELLSLGGCSSSWLDVYNVLTDSWRSVDTGIPRNTAATVLLPDGTVLLLHGENPTVDQSAALNRRAPQAGDPRFIQIFHALSPDMRVDTYPEQEDGTGSDGSLAPFRGYHNSVALLKDGRVLVQGGVHLRGDIGCEQPNARILTPPYLNPPAGSQLTRPAWAAEIMQQFNQSEWPQWSNVSASIEPIFMRVGGVLQVALLSGVPLRSYVPPSSLNGGGAMFPSVDDVHAQLPTGGVVLMGLQSFTHAFDMEQRYIPLEYADEESNKTATNGASGNGDTSAVVRVRVPAAPALQPGEYLLFLVSASGVPSHALHAHVLDMDESLQSAYAYPPAPAQSPSPPPTPEPQPHEGEHGLTPLRIALLSTVCALVAVLFIAMVCCFVRRQRRSEQLSSAMMCAQQSVHIDSSLNTDTGQCRTHTHTHAYTHHTSERGEGNARTISGQGPHVRILCCVSAAEPLIFGGQEL
jgi:hypothetical protein